jgi:hypothetical protein
MGKKLEDVSNQSNSIISHVNTLLSYNPDRRFSVPPKMFNAQPPQVQDPEMEAVAQLYRTLKSNPELKDFKF